MELVLKTPRSVPVSLLKKRRPKLKPKELKEAKPHPRARILKTMNLLQRSKRDSRPQGLKKKNLNVRDKKSGTPWMKKLNSSALLRTLSKSPPSVCRIRSRLNVSKSCKNSSLLWELLESLPSQRERVLKLKSLRFKNRLWLASQSVKSKDSSSSS